MLDAHHTGDQPATAVLRPAPRRSRPCQPVVPPAACCCSSCSTEQQLDVSSHKEQPKTELSLAPTHHLGHHGGVPASGNFRNKFRYDSSFFRFTLFIVFQQVSAHV